MLFVVFELVRGMFGSDWMIVGIVGELMDVVVGLEYRNRSGDGV